MSDTIVFSGGTLVTPLTLYPADLVVRDGIIVAIRPPGSPLADEQVVDCTGLYVGPGLIDLHVHGGQGHDFVTADAEEVARGVEYHLSQGTTGLLSTALSVPISELRQAISAAREAAKYSRSSILGFHVEGIYFDHAYRGAHLSEYVHNPDPDEYLPLIADEGDFIREWTLAPELPGAIDFIAACRDAGIVTSAGHSQATYAHMMRAIEAGVTHSTHFMCAMGNLRNEPLHDIPAMGFAPGVCETVLLHDEISTEVIADGFHLHPALIQLAVKCKGRERVCLISDAMKGVGLPNGMHYLFGDQDCIVEGGIAILVDRPGGIAGSVTPLVASLRFAHRQCGISLVDAWAMASQTPAKVIGVAATRGTIAPGKIADLLVLDEKLNIAYVYAKGEKVVSNTLPAG